MTDSISKVDPKIYVRLDTDAMDPEEIEEIKAEFGLDPSHPDNEIFGWLSAIFFDDGNWFIHLEDNNGHAIETSLCYLGNESR